MPSYAELEICKTNPFASIDQTDVGQFMKIAIEKGNATRTRCSGAIAENARPTSTQHVVATSATRLWLTYVSCSPFRVPVAAWLPRKPPRETGRLFRISEKNQTVDASMKNAQAPVVEGLGC